MAYTINSKKMAKNTIALYIRMGITMVISFFTARITLQQLGVDDYGLNNLVGSVVSMFGFINGSMGTAVQRFYSYEIGKGESDRLKRIFGTGLYIHIIIAIITLFLAEIFAIFFLHKLNIPEERMTAAQIVFQVSVLSLILNIINVPYAALLRAREEFSKMAVIEIMQSILRLLILFLLIVINKDKLITLSLLGSVITVFYVVSLYILAKKYDETHSKPIKDQVLIKQMISFISFLIVTVLASLLKTKGIVVLVNIFFGLAVNAAYAVAVQVSHLVNTFVMNFKQSMVPQLMSAYGANDKNAMCKIINYGTKITFALMLLITMPFLFEAQFILEIWLKTPPDHAAHLVKLLLIYINISSFTYFVYQGVHACGNIKGQQIWVSGLYLANIAVVYLVFKFGASFSSALYVNMFISVVQCIVNLIYAKANYNYDIGYFGQNILLPCIIAVLVVYFPLRILQLFIGQGTFSSIIMILGSLLSVCVVSCYVLLSKNERKLIQTKVLSLISTKR